MLIVLIVFIVRVMCWNGLFEKLGKLEINLGSDSVRQLDNAPLSKGRVKLSSGTAPVLEMGMGAARAEYQSSLANLDSIHSYI